MIVCARMERKAFSAFPKSISREEIAALPLTRYEGPVRLVSAEAELDDAVERLRKERVLGFDTETKPSFKKGETHPVALMQIAASDAVYIISMRRFPASRQLGGLLADASIIKAGVDLGQDKIKLAEAGYAELAGIADLSRIARSLEITTTGMRSLAAIILGIRVSKGAKRSNWGARNLTPAQIAYAATDAWVSREIYLALMRMRLV